VYILKQKKILLAGLKRKTQAKIKQLTRSKAQKGQFRQKKKKVTCWVENLKERPK